MLDLDKVYFASNIPVKHSTDLVDTLSDPKIQEKKAATKTDQGANRCNKNDKQLAVSYISISSVGMLQRD